MELDLSTLSTGEAEDFEAYAGVPVASLRPGAQLPAKAVTAIVWILRRRLEPGFTVEQARAVRMDEVGRMFEGVPFPADRDATSPTSPPSAASTA